MNNDTSTSIMNEPSTSMINEPFTSVINEPSTSMINHPSTSSKKIMKRSKYKIIDDSSSDDETNHELLPHQPCSDLEDDDEPPKVIYDHIVDEIDSKDENDIEDIDMEIDQSSDKKIRA